jgi:hypothetical protein
LRGGAGSPGEPVSAGKFPANRENNREFSKKRAVLGEMACLNDRKINEFSLEFPTCRNREFLYAEQGIDFREQGIGPSDQGVEWARDRKDRPCEDRDNKAEQGSIAVHSRLKS